MSVEPSESEGFILSSDIELRGERSSQKSSQGRFLIKLELQGLRHLDILVGIKRLPGPFQE